METDIRVQLENELDSLREENVETWIQRCFEACDPRYESDWLSGMLELAYMQFPDHYEVRSACSRATILEARRLSSEGDKKEAVRRLEQLLEADPYCTEGFELLEELTRASSEDDVPAVTSAPPAAVTPPAPPPAPQIEPEPHVPSSEDLQNLFTNEEFLVGNEIHLTADEGEPAPVVELTNSHDAPPQFAPIEPIPVASIDPTPTPPVEAPASLPPVESHHPAPAVLVGAPPQENSQSRPWDNVWKLPRSATQAAGDPHYLQLVVTMAERMRGLGRPDAALRILVDHREDLQASPSWSEHVRSAIMAWTNKLVQSNEGPVAAQVAAWGSEVLHESAELKEMAGELKRRHGLPTSTPLLSNDPWKARIEATPGDASVLEEVYKTHSHDTESLVMLFRQLAVEHSEDSRHILNLGWAYFKASTPVLALVHTQRALKLAPTRRGFQLLAEIYQSLGQPQLKEAALRSLQETAAP